MEGGAETHRHFLENPEWWDEIREEVSPRTVEDGTRAPQLPPGVRLVPVAGEALKPQQETGEEE